jgi:tetratricopeptide (TPR) repeat protein
MRRLLALILGICTVASCSRPIRPSPNTAPLDPVAGARTRMAAAVELGRAGCLDCLSEALREYQAARTVSAVAAEATAGAARTAALVAIRERELGLEDSGALTQARLLAASSPELSASLSLLFEIGDTLAGRGAGSQVTSDAQILAAGPALRNRIAWTDSLRARADENELTAYLWVAFNCTYNSPTNEVVDHLADLLPAWKDTPLIRYRIATCTAPRIPALNELLKDDPRFLEITYYIGLQAVIQGDLDEADAQFERAFSWRPRWARVANTRGTVFMTAEEFERAAEFYDRALEVVPDYAEALLGKVRALTFAGRYQDALAATDVLLALERWYIGDARYWRAMNEVQLEQHDAAWDDVERAARLITNAEVPKLAGIIAVRRQQFAVARAKFEGAWQRGDSDCEVPYYLGTVLVEQREWSRSVDAFIAAAACFDRWQEAIEGQIARIRAAVVSGAPTERQARQIARREQQLATQARMRATSWFNTAAACFNLTRYVEARQYALHVTDDPQFGERARDLLSRIPAGTGTP